MVNEKVTPSDNGGACKDKFYVLELSDGLVTVPKKWITGDQKHTFWPNEKSPRMIHQLVSGEVCPNEETWEKCEIIRQFGTGETYQRALEKENLAVNTSDVNSETDEEKEKQKSRKRREKRFSSEGEDSDPEQIEEILTNIPVKKPCLIKRPEYSKLATTAHSSISVLPKEVVEEERGGEESDPPKGGTPPKMNKSEEEGRRGKNERQRETDARFQTYVVKTLTDISNRIKRIESKINHKNLPVEHQQTVQEQKLQIDILETLDFPMNSVAVVKHYEERLKKEDDFKQSLKTALSMKAHKLLNKTVTIMMKILMTDETASKYSWTGQKENKQKFETLELWKVIYGAVKMNFPNATESDVSAPLKTWLAHGPDRMKKNKEKEQSREKE